MVFVCLKVSFVKVENSSFFKQSETEVESKVVLNILCPLKNNNNNNIISKILKLLWYEGIEQNLPPLLMYEGLPSTNKHNLFLPFRYSPINMYSFVSKLVL